MLILVDEVIFILILVDEVIFIVILVYEVIFILILVDEVIFILILVDEVVFILILVDEVIFIVILVYEVIFILILVDYLRSCRASVCQCKRCNNSLEFSPSILFLRATTRTRIGIGGEEDEAALIEVKSKITHDNSIFIVLYYLLVSRKRCS
jgi:hypothetical protein